MSESQLAPNPSVVGHHGHRAPLIEIQYQSHPHLAGAVVPTLANPGQVYPLATRRVLGESMEGPIYYYRTVDGFEVVHKRLARPITPDTYAKVVAQVDKFRAFAQEHDWVGPNYAYYFTPHPSDPQWYLQLNLINQYLPGQSLDKFFERERCRLSSVHHNQPWHHSLPLDVWLRTAYSLFGMLTALERARIAHLDIKPENLMVSNNKLYLIDFALYCTAGGSTDTISCLDIGLRGTPGFVAPELALRYGDLIYPPGLSFTPDMVTRPSAVALYKVKADVWSACALLAYELLGQDYWIGPDWEASWRMATRTRPGLSVLEWMIERMHQPSIDAFISDVGAPDIDPLGLFTILYRGLAEDPEARASPEELYSEVVDVYRHLQGHHKTPLEYQEHYDQFYETGYIRPPATVPLA